MARPAERIEVPGTGVVLRRYGAADVDALHAVIEESRDHLRPFMPWADQSRDVTAEFVKGAEAKWDAGEDFSYLIMMPPDSTTGEPESVLGGCGIHARGGPETLEIGYWLHPGATGRGLMTAVAGCLTDVALSLDGITRVEIRCDEANLRSAAIPRRLGFRLEGIEDRPPTAPGDHGRMMVWVAPTPAENP